MKTIKLWKHNRVDQEYELTLDELKEKYLSYLKTKEADWVLHYGHRTVWAFVSSDDGLCSVINKEDMRLLERELMPIRHSMNCYSEKK